MHKLCLHLHLDKFAIYTNMPEDHISSVISRLQDFINSTGLSSSQFADQTGIPRPSLSQILHGRNKSINDVLLRKLDQSFPNLNLSWLLFGRGNMYSSQNIEISERQNKLRQENETIEITDMHEDTARMSEFLRYGKAGESGTDEVMPDRERSATTAPASASSKKRRIKSVIVLYTDNSFETFEATDR